MLFSHLKFFLFLQFLIQRSHFILLLIKKYGWKLKFSRDPSVAVTLSPIAFLTHPSNWKLGFSRCRSNDAYSASQHYFITLRRSDA